MGYSLKLSCLVLILLHLFNSGLSEYKCNLYPLGTSLPFLETFDVSCYVRSINDVFYNMSMVDVNYVGKLKVRCDNFRLLEGTPLQINQKYPDFDVLVNNTFGFMRNLTDLVIENCKLITFPTSAFNGVSQLKSLVYRSQNYEDGNPNFQLSPETFSQLQLLEKLDLSENNMIKLPQTLLCPLRKLQFLNLTKNSFTDVSNVGLSTGTRDNVLCYVDAQKVILSHNKLRKLTDKCFAAVDQLKELHLDHNYISSVDELAFYGLKQLKILNLSNNHIDVLPNLVFRACGELSELYLHKNNIDMLSLVMFTGLKHLQILDVSHNKISSFWYDNNILDDVQLLILRLNHNQLSRLDAIIFRNQHMLQELYLDHNEIEIIPDNSFSVMNKLRILTLNNNRIRHITDSTFNGLDLINALFLNNNNIDDIHIDAFSNNISLMEINLSNNKLSSVPDAVQSLLNLRSLDLSDNVITFIQNASYRGLENLYSLILSRNKIGNLSIGAFAQLPSLRVLELDHNQIVTIQENTFHDVQYLHALRLDSNFLFDINGLFGMIPDLFMLNLSCNHIEWFDYALVPLALQWLDLHDNRIDILANYYDVETFSRLRTLDASFNQITELDPKSLPKGIEIVLLNDNHIQSIQSFTFMNKPNLMRVDLRRNNLTNLEVGMLRLTEFSAIDRKPLPKFSVSENPYLCDCNMEWIKGVDSQVEARHYPRFVDIDNVTCKLLFNRQRKPLLLKNTQPSQFLCKYRNHCFALCHCCEFDACDCEMSCPERCSCFYDQSWNTNIVDCSSANHIVVPPRIPMDVTDLFLDGNDITSLYSHTFIGRKNMRVLYLNNSNVQFINNRTFNGLKSLQSLYLQNNLIANLSGYEFERLVNLRHLYLSHNHITSIGNTTFMHLRDLEVLHLDNNFIAHFQVWNLNQNDKLVDIQLSNNPWPCECQFIDNFSDWLQMRTDLVHDVNDVNCVFNNTFSLSLVKYNITACTNATEVIYSQFTGKGFHAAIITISVLFLLLILIVVLIVVFWKKIKAFFRSKFDVRVFDTERRIPDDNKLSDIFVLYSRKDEAFVVDALAAELQTRNPHFKLCLYYRDLPIGSYLSDAILEAMLSSKRTIIVLSMNLIRNEWFFHEFQNVHHHLMQSLKDKIIVIYVGCLTEMGLVADLRLWLKSSIFLHWGEKRFWEKLKEALPKCRNRKSDPLHGRDHSVSIHI